MYGTGGDAKGQPTQTNSISHGSPWLRIRKIMVGRFARFGVRWDLELELNWQRFKRALGPFDATMVVIGGIIGAGIFINPVHRRAAARHAAARARRRG